MHKDGHDDRTMYGSLIYHLT